MATVDPKEIRQLIRQLEELVSRAKKLRETLPDLSTINEFITAVKNCPSGHFVEMLSESVRNCPSGDLVEMLSEAVRKCPSADLIEMLSNAIQDLPSYDEIRRLEILANKLKNP